MMTSREVRDRLQALEERMDGIASSIDRIEAALVVRDPGNARSVEAYDGLRRQVAASAGDRRRLLVLLTGLANAVDQGAGGDDLTSVLEEACLQASAARVVDPAMADLYEIVDGQGTDLEILTPAWVDSHTGALIRTGTARRCEPVAPSPEPVVAEAQEPLGTPPQADASVKPAELPVRQPDDTSSLVAQEAADDPPAHPIVEGEQPA